MPGSRQEGGHRDQQGRDCQACAVAECQPLSLGERFQGRGFAGRQAAGAGRRERAQHGYPQRRAPGEQQQSAERDQDNGQIKRTTAPAE